MTNPNLLPAWAISLLLFVIGPIHSISGQVAFVPSTEFPVINFQNQLDLPWTGGLNAGQFSQLDIDLDGTLDVLIFDRIGDRIMPMIQKGSPGIPEFEYAPEAVAAFPKARHWLLTADYNLDGKYDLFTSSQNGIKVYINTSDSMKGLTFELYPGVNPIESVIPGSNQQILEVLELDIPAIIDLDNDGDLDILAFNTLGTLVDYHKNLSQETFGHSDSLTFLLEEACWGHVMEDDVDFIISTGVFCKNGTADGGGGVHAGSSMLALDMDGDGDKELALGDIGSSAMFLLTNGGTADHADITNVNTAFPASNPADLDVFPAAYHLDLNNDNKRDLIISPNSAFNTENVSVGWYYPNTGTDSVPTFSYLRDNLFVEEMIDVGSGSFPILFDYDQNGVTDLLIGNYGYYDSGDFFPQIALFRNSGSNSSPFFELITGDVGDMGQLFLSPDVYPALGDVDGDGDYDMLVGRADGTLDLYRNFSLSPTNILPQLGFESNNYAGIDVGGNATPQLIDVDGDSLIDLLIGERNGNVNYYRNTGTHSSPAFSLETETLGGIQMSVDGFQPGYSVPSAFMANGQLHLIVGSDIGTMKYYRDIRSDLGGSSWAGDTVLKEFSSGVRTAPAVADLNEDGFVELIVGNTSGGLNLFLGTKPTMVGLDRDMLLASDYFRIFPNPSKGDLTLELKKVQEIKSLQLYSIRGKKLGIWKATSGHMQLDLRQFPAGIYVMQVSLKDGRSLQEKLMLRDE